MPEPDPLGAAAQPERDARVEGIDCPMRDRLVEAIYECLGVLAELEALKIEAAGEGQGSLEISLAREIEQTIVITNAALHALRWHRDTHRC